MMNRALDALTQLIAAIEAAKVAGASDEQLQAAPRPAAPGPVPA